MKIAGVIAEYNPFHSGHKWHLAETRRRTGCDFVVVCMAGSYVQRGEAACLSKWARAEAALRCGADAVFELPALFAVRSADAFARGGVGVLEGLGVDALSFGCENAQLQTIEALAELREHEPETLSDAVRRGLAEGKSHARARGEAVAAMLGMEPEALNAPNLVLATEYVRQLRRRSSAMEIVVIPRAGDYHDADVRAPFASATAVRAALTEGRKVEALAAVPEAAREILSRAGSMHAPDDLLLWRLRQTSEAELSSLPGVAEGLERRIFRCAAVASTREELLDALKCKRYTRARLSRILACALLGLTNALAERHPEPEYARLMGMRRDARPLLSELKRRAKLPIVSDPVRLQSDECFRLECRATDLRALQCDDPSERRAGQELTRKFVMVE